MSQRSVHGNKNGRIADGRPMENGRPETAARYETRELRRYFLAASFAASVAFFAASLALAAASFDASAA